MRSINFLTIFIIGSFLINSSFAKRTELGKGPNPPRMHAQSLFGKVKYPRNFKHLDYVNPNAPKGGNIRMWSPGTFDSLNGYNIKGNPAVGLEMLFDTLTASSMDEPLSEYGLLAEWIQVAPDRSWVIFKIRDIAKWHDGKKITSEDVVFSFYTLIEAHPHFKGYYNGVKKVVALGKDRVKFIFKKEVSNPELPVIVGQMAVFPKHFWKGKDFLKTTLTPPLGSGPYKIEKIDPGKSITYTRVKNYWAKDLPIMKGRYNFDRIHFDYYKDSTVAFEAFKAGEFDFYEESMSKNWATGYNFPALKSGKVIKKFVKNKLPTGMQAFVFNTRKSLFKERSVRKALAKMFNFEWTNKTLFYSAYTRSKSYFSNSELAATGKPTADEIRILRPLAKYLHPKVLTEEFVPSVNKSPRDVRNNIRQALRLLKKAGWKIDKNKNLVDSKGKNFEFEILLVNPGFERVVLPFKKSLSRLGITVNVRTVDSSQYQNRIRNFDYDMIVWVWQQTESPGNDQRNMWRSDYADMKGSRNYAGIKNPAIDKLVEMVTNVSSRKELVTTTRALDRALLWGHYCIPNWYLTGNRIAYWNKFGQPEKVPYKGFQFHTWWVK